jgi:hypothetical protein
VLNPTQKSIRSPTKRLAEYAGALVLMAPYKENSMKPYFAILYDSFLESVSSKVLWILLLAWTLILAALFPLSLSQGESYAFNGTNIKSAKTILDQLAAASAGKGTRKQRAVFAKLDQEFQGNLKQRQANQTRISVGKLIDSLNKLLLVKDLYDKEIWTTASKKLELKDLVENENRSAMELERLNRGLIDLAFDRILVWTGFVGHVRWHQAWQRVASLNQPSKTVH